MRDLANAEWDPSDQVIFVSDVHLYFGGGPYLERFTQFLRSLRERAVTAVYIHGDLFDFYVGPRQGRQPFYAPLFDALQMLTDAEIPVGILHGNRDFLMGKRFSEAGCQLLPDQISVRCGGDRVHLSHGDELCIHDRSYQFWARGVLRAAPIKFLVRMLPVSVAVWLARRYRAISKRKWERRRKREPVRTSRLPTVFDGVQELCAQNFHEVIICGHIHDLADTQIALNPGGSRDSDASAVRLLTTGAWEEGANFIQWGPGGFTLERLEPKRAWSHEATPLGLRQ